MKTRQTTAWQALAYPCAYHWIGSFHCLFYGRYAVSWAEWWRELQQ